MQLLTFLLLLLFVTALSWWATRIIIRRASSWGLQDIPNHRSSHALPTPRGGGAAIVVASLTGLALTALVLPALLAGLGRSWPGRSAEALPEANAALQSPGDTAALAIPLLTGALILGITGLWDDIKSLRVRDRLIAQAAAVALLFFTLGLIPGISAAFWQGIDTLRALLHQPAAGHDLLSMTLAGAVLLILLAGCIWWVNLFNFMDGIDGIAASQALFMLLAGVLLRSLVPIEGSAPTRAVLHAPAGLALVTPVADPHSVTSLVVAAAVIGFLIHNWPPARIFMGDAGSLFLGYLILVVAAFDVASGSPGSLHPVPTSHAQAAPEPLAGMLQPLCVWLILGATFITDATLTLLRRLLRGENPGTPHRSHAYQRLSRHYDSHRRATLVYCLINLCWLLPLAIVATVHPDHAAETMILAYLPLVLLAWHFGAGREETPSRP